MTKLVTTLTREQARKVLMTYKKTNLISRIYDYGDVAEALITLIPKFEYPEWSFCTLACALKEIDEIERLRGLCGK